MPSLGSPSQCSAIPGGKKFFPLVKTGVITENTRTPKRRPRPPGGPGRGRPPVAWRRRLAHRGRLSPPRPRPRPRPAAAPQGLPDLGGSASRAHRPGRAGPLPCSPAPAPTGSVSTGPAAVRGGRRPGVGARAALPRRPRGSRWLRSLGWTFKLRDGGRSRGCVCISVCLCLCVCLCMCLHVRVSLCFYMCLHTSI